MGEWSGIRFLAKPGRTMTPKSKVSKRVKYKTYVDNRLKESSIKDLLS